ncbi:hypothetical protein HUI95_18475 [Aeromonas dhakensis]|uniref:hypothetical protein n=1 Tax=Aeromonas dhakensis TaxID=196024 RepID=UPI0010085840|nr:hypothetical protein [Aeromonas dhakensis]QSR44871.1 hypothetical protein HUI95_18260 [Aeromonas dhakensis]QSR44907.1 hypothetical protein HUI95_18475 [Aeromonas dhakensis]
MAAGIRIKRSRHVYITDSDVNGAEIGIDIAGGEHINVNRVLFDNVGTGLKARDVGELNISNCTDTKNDTKI